MKTQNLIAIVGAMLLTTASLGAVHYNVNSQPTEINGSKVINLAPVIVHPDAKDWRAAALLNDVSATGLASMPSLVRVDEAGSDQLSLIGAQLAMPYYSFGNKFGRISKE